MSSYWSTAFEPNMAVESIELSSCSLLSQLLIASLFWIDIQISFPPQRISLGGEEIEKEGTRAARKTDNREQKQQQDTTDQ